MGLGGRRHSGQDPALSLPHISTPASLRIAPAWYVHFVFMEILPTLQGPPHGASFGGPLISSLESMHLSVGFPLISSLESMYLSVGARRAL